MKIQIPTTTEVEITHVRIAAAVNYEEDEIPNDFPGRIHDVWHADINIDTGKIEGWPQGRVEDMFLTVKDSGSYYLIDANSQKGTPIASRENDYAPNDLIPGKYGDTIELKIDGNGIVTNWPKNPDVSQLIGIE